MYHCCTIILLEDTLFLDFLEIVYLFTNDLFKCGVIWVYGIFTIFKIRHLIYHDLPSDIPTALELLFYKVVSIFLSVAKDLSNRWTDIVPIYIEASYRSLDGYTLFSALPYSFNKEPLDARGATACFRYMSFICLQKIIFNKNCLLFL